MTNKTILIQNYHTPATTALVRDFTKIGLEVVSPDSDWGKLDWYSPNHKIGSRLISEEDYFNLEPGYVLITCKPQEESLKGIARRHSDTMILNVAQQHQSYEAGISDVMLCPDIDTFRNYTSFVKHKLLYFPKPHLAANPGKDIEACFARKNISAFVSIPHVWEMGSAFLSDMKQKYPFPFENYGFETANGHLMHSHANEQMADSFFVAQCKDFEAYGLACLESMMLGTPIVTLKKFVSNKTLGEYFLNDENSIICDTIDEVIERLLALTLHDYRQLSERSKAQVLSRTSDENTINRLKSVLKL